MPKPVINDKKKEAKRQKLKVYFQQRPPRTLYQFSLFFDVQLPPERWDSEGNFEEERLNQAWHAYYNAMHCVCHNAHYHPDTKQLTWN